MVCHVMASALNIYCGLARKNAQAVLQTHAGRWLMLLLLVPAERGTLEKKFVIVEKKGKIISFPILSLKKENVASLGVVRK